jgi:hypothetical protein
VPPALAQWHFWVLQGASHPIERTFVQPKLKRALHVVPGFDAVELAEPDHVNAMLEHNHFVSEHKQVLTNQAKLQRLIHDLYELSFSHGRIASFAIMETSADRH